MCAAVVGDVVAAAVLERRPRARWPGTSGPKDVYVVDDLPRTATGKVRRTAIAAWLGLEPASAEAAAGAPGAPIA